MRTALQWRWTALILLCFLAGMALRLPHLEDKPLHLDEAVQAFKFGDLLEKGEYRYDPREYHGPTLYYFTLPVAWLTGKKQITAVTESDLRLVPVLFGAALVLLFLLVADGLGRPEAFCAAALAALSPAMVYYSRYYIQEMLLAFFALALIASVWRYAVRPRAVWAVAAGISLGLMYATKETFVLHIGALVAAALLLFVYERRRGGFSVNGPDRRRFLRHGVLALVCAGILSTLFFSSFLTHARGPLDAILTYGNYLAKSGDSAHEKPWYAYLHWLVFYKKAPGHLWTEGLIVVLALAGIFRAFSGGAGKPLYFRRGLALYTLVLFGGYSLLPYKTPWLMLGFLTGMIALAGIGTVALVRAVPGHAYKAVLIAILVAGYAHLGWLSGRTAFRFHSSPRNPYAYTPTVPDLFKMVRRVEAIAALHPDHEHMLIRVLGTHYWPLPWYLRTFDRIGYWETLPEGSLDAPVIILDPELEEAVRARLKDAYVTDYAGLRPGVVLFALIREDLWTRYLDGTRK